MLTRAMIEHPFGPQSLVRPASNAWGIKSAGWIVTHLPSGLTVWTGAFMPISEAWACIQKRLRETTTVSMEVVK